MPFGPVAGREASAAVIVVNAPGVAPVQSTTTLSAKAKLEKRSNKQPNSSLQPEQLVIVILTLLKIELKWIYRSRPRAANLVRELLRKRFKKATGKSREMLIVIGIFCQLCKRLQQARKVTARKSRGT